MQAEVNNNKVLGILAGDGLLPVILAKHARKLKQKFIVFTFEKFNYQLKKFKPVQCDIGNPLRLVSSLKSFYIEDIVLAGSFSRFLIQSSVNGEVDRAFKKLVRDNFRKGDDSLLKSIARFFEDFGFNIIGPHEFDRNIVEGKQKIMSIGKPSKENIHDADFASHIFNSFSELDIGQSIIVSNGLCLGIETNTGTDNMIKNYSNYIRKNSDKLSHTGGIFFKASKPPQDKRFDLPVVGPNTLKLVKNARLDGIVVEANNVIFINKEKLIKLANSLEIFLWSRKIDD